MEDNRERIRQIRTEYAQHTLLEKDAPANPVVFFNHWFTEALNADVNEPNAMVLSTVNAEHKPSARVVLLRNFSDAGFVFYTNYNSRKGSEISVNPFAALTFFWPELERQVRIEGKLEMQSSAESDEYFNSRPEGSKLGAWASPQSQVIESRETLDELIEHMTNMFAGKTPERPEWWGGYLLKPERIEFWQGRPSRLHDRLQYTNENGTWVMKRLAP